MSRPGSACAPATLSSLCARPPGVGRAGLLLCLLLLLGLPALGFAGRIVLTESRPDILLNPHIRGELDISRFLEQAQDNDNTAAFDASLPDEARFQPVPDTGITTRMGVQRFWIRGSVSRSSHDDSRATDWLLLVENSHVQRARLFVHRQGQQVQQLPLPEERFPLFELDLPADSVTRFYLQVEVSGVHNLPIKIWHRDAYRQHQRSLLPLWGFLFGALAALALYNFFICVSLGERAYLYLSLFLCSTLGLTLAREGFLTPFWPEMAGEAAHRFEDGMQLLTVALAALLTRHYMNTPRHYRLANRVLGLASIASVLGIVLMLVEHLGSTLTLAWVWSCNLLFAVPAALVAMHSSDRTTRYFIAGWSVFFITYVIYQGSQFGWLPVNDFTQHTKELALCLLGLSLSLGLAEQIRRERFEKQRALQRQQETMLELKYSEEQIQKKVLRDTLLEFPEWQALSLALQGVILRSVDTGESVVLVMMDLHRVDQVEGQLGHAARNELLTRATKRLCVILRSVSGVLPLDATANEYVPMAVLEDDRYGFILTGMSDVTINRAIEEVDQAMSRPFFYQGSSLQPGVSFGVARLGEHGDDAATLLQHAQRSLLADRQKNLEKDSEFDCFDQYNARNIALINELRSAIHEDQVTLYFQPVYDLRRHQVCGIEVFARWESLNGNRISPSEMFCLAEIGGFVSELTLRVIEKALRYFVTAVNVRHAPLKLSVNLSPKCLREDHFLEEVSHLLARYRVPPRCLSLEIKEAAIIEDPSITREALNRIRSMEIGLTIDELGAAYSNPSYLGALPVTEVKLDPRFVAELHEYECRVRVQMVIALCRDRHIKLVVHGVEDESRLRELEQMGCTFAQGHYLASPVPAREFRLSRLRPDPVSSQPL